MPDEILIVENLPYNPSSGKLQKEVLREQYRDRYAAQAAWSGGSRNANAS